MPMRMGVRGKLFLVSVAMVLAVVFLAGLYLEGQLVEWAQGRAEVELQGHARLVRVLLEHRQDGDSRHGRRRLRHCLWRLPAFALCRL